VCGGVLLAMAADGGYVVDRGEILNTLRAGTKDAEEGCQIKA
jgi:hypothetical protein